MSAAVRHFEEDTLDPVLRFALQLHGRRLDAHRADVLATVMLLTSKLPATLLAQKGINQGRFKLDSTLVQKLFMACPARLKLLLADAPAFPYLAPEVHQSLFPRAFRLASSTPPVRAQLLHNLGAFLARNPDQAEHYRRPIMRAMQAREQAVAYAALDAATCYLEALSRKELSLIDSTVRRLRGVWQPWAVRALLLLWVRRGTLGPEVEAFCRSEPIVAYVRKLDRQARQADTREIVATYLRTLDQPSRPCPPPPPGSVRTRLAWLMREPNRRDAAASRRSPAGKPPAPPTGP